MPEFEVIWDGRGELNGDWPPQRWQPEYTFEPRTPPPVNHAARKPRTCEGCGQPFRTTPQSSRVGRKFCSRACYHALGGARAFVGRRNRHP